MWLFLRSSERTRVILVNEKVEVLVVRGWISSSSRWSLPGGGLHRGEKPLQGVIREAYEEVGVALNTEDLRHLGEFRSTSKGLQLKLHVFIATVQGKPALRLQWHEIATAKWVDVQELTPASADPDVLQALQMMTRPA